MSKTRYFIKCDHCGKKIYVGDPIYTIPGRCGTYCSAECYATETADIDELTLSHADNCLCEVYKEEVQEVIVEQVSDPIKLTSEEVENLLSKKGEK